MPETFCPYVGLEPYTAKHREYFFGRKREQAIVSANLFAAPLTVLYGPSGVGKSSLLRAGVIPRLNSPTRRVASVYYNEWKNPGFAGAVTADLTKAAGLASGESALDVVLNDAAQHFRGTIVLLFDQFEDYLLYQAQSEEGGRFERQLALSINNRNLDVGFLFAVREDWLSKLEDHFGARIPVLRNCLHLEHMDTAAAEQAIRGPLAKFNEDFGPTAPVGIEDALVNKILQDVKIESRLASDSAGAGLPPAARPRGVQPSFLQLILTRLWHEEMDAGSNVLRLETLDRLRGSKAIVREHVDAQMKKLSDHERELCARMFRFLVMPEGGKIAQLSDDLVLVAEEPRETVHPILEKLSRARILSRSEPPERYEILHDVLAPAVLHWRTEYQAAQERKAADQQREAAEREREAAERRAEAEARTAKKLLVLSIALGILFVAAVTLAFIAYDRGRQSRSRELAAAAVSNLPADPERSILLAQYALRARHTPEAEEALHRAVLRSRVRRTIASGDCRMLHTAWNSDETRVAGGCEDGSARVWDAAKKLLLTLKGHSGEVRAIAFSPDGNQVLTGGLDTTARVWDAQSGAQLHSLQGHSGAVNAAVYSADGARLALGGADGRATLWDARSGRLLREFPGHTKEIKALALTADGARMVTGGPDGTILLWDTGRAGAPRQLAKHDGAVWAAVFNPDATSVAAALSDRTVRVWSLEGAAPPKIFRGHRNFPVAVAFDPTGTLLAGAGLDHTARVWNVDSGNEVMVLAGHRETVHSVRFSATGETISTGSLDGDIRTWHAGRSAEVFTIDQAPHAVYSAVYSPEGTRLATASADGTVRLWDAASGSQIRIFSGHEGEVMDAAFNADGQRLASAARDFTARIWSIAQDAAPVMTFRQNSEWVRSVSFHPVGGLLAAANHDGHVTLYDLSGGRPPADLRAHGDRIHQVAFSPDGGRFATASSDGTARLWDTAARSEVAELRHGGAVLALAFHPAEAKLATGGNDHRAIVWDLRTRTELLTLSGHTQEVSAAAFDRSGNLLATATADGTIKVWFAASGNLLFTLDSHEGRISRVDFSPDGKYLASAGDDGAVRIHLTRTADLISLAAQRVTRPFTDEDCRKYLKSRCP